MAIERGDVLSRKSVYRSDLLTGQSVLVSGGGTGIGRGIAMLCGELGARVVVCGRRLELLEETCDWLSGADISCTAIAANIRVPEEVDALFDAAGPLDVVVNNAGGQFAQHSIDISDKGWRAVVDTNLNGTWTMMQRAARRWRSDGRSGSIVNIVIPYVRGMFGLAHAVAARSGVAFVSRLSLIHI